MRLLPLEGNQGTSLIQMDGFTCFHETLITLAKTYHIYPPGRLGF